MIVKESNVKICYVSIWLFHAHIGKQKIQEIQEGKSTIILTSSESEIKSNAQSVKFRKLNLIVEFLCLKLL